MEAAFKKGNASFTQRMRLRVGGLPELPSGSRIRLAIVRIDELMQEIECRYVGLLESVLPDAESAAVSGT